METISPNIDVAMLPKMSIINVPFIVCFTFIEDSVDEQRKMSRLF